MPTSTKAKTPGRSAAAKAAASPKKVPPSKQPNITAKRKGTKPRLNNNIRRNEDGVQLADPDDIKYVDILNSKSIQAAWLTSYSMTGSVDQSCRELKVYRLHINKLRDTDPDFEAGYQEAFKHVVRGWEQEVARRAFKGVTREIYHQGEVVGHEQVYSDRLAEFMIKAHGQSEKYNPPSRASIETNGTAIIAYREMDEETLNKAMAKHAAALGILEASHADYKKFMGKDDEESQP